MYLNGTLRNQILTVTSSVAKETENKQNVISNY